MNKIPIEQMCHDLAIVFVQRSEKAYPDTNAFLEAYRKAYEDFYSSVTEGM